MTGRRIARGLALGAPAVGVSLTTLASWVTARRITAPGPREDKFVTPWELGILYEDVAFGTEDGLLLRGMVAARAEGKDDGDRPPRPPRGEAPLRRDSRGPLEEGSQRLALRPPRTGSSEGDFMSLGYFETLDAFAAVGYALSRAPGFPLG